MAGENRQLETKFVVVVAHGDHHSQAYSPVSGDNKSCAQHSKLGHHYRRVFECMLHVMVTKTENEIWSHTLMKIYYQCGQLSVLDCFEKNSNIYIKPSPTYFSLYVILCYHIHMIILYLTLYHFSFVWLLMLCCMFSFFTSLFYFIWSHCMHRMLMHCVPTQLNAKIFIRASILFLLCGALSSGTSIPWRLILVTLFSIIQYQPGKCSQHLQHFYKCQNFFNQLQWPSRHPMSTQHITPRFSQVMDKSWSF